MFAWSLNSKGQGLAPEVIPPSPEASSLGKYLSTPVSYFSGLPQVSIPFFSLKDRDLSLNVGLSYHAGGIRVEEIASREGLGWNLQAAGSISRSVRGIPDDGIRGFLSSHRTVEEFRNAPNNATSINGKWALMGEAIAGEADYEPDVFNFSYPGYSGKFVIEQSGEVMTIPESDHKITYVMSGGDGIASFKVIDGNGYTYFFGSYSGEEAYDLTQYTFSYTDGSGNIPDTGDDHHYYSSWHLVAMTSPTSGSVITFRYDTHNTKSLLRTGQRRAITDGLCAQPGIRTSYLINEVSESVLSSITYANGRIDFDYKTSERVDFEGDHALYKVRRYGLNNELLKTYELETDYFVSFDNGSTSVPLPNLTFTKEHFTHRLYLKSVKEWDKEEEHYKLYNLDYHENISLPNRFSFAQDAWGFYNKAYKNTNLIPIHFHPSPAITPANEVVNYLLGADRRTNPSVSKALSLKAITYPTGGKTELVYESNGVARLGTDSNFENSQYGVNEHMLVEYAYRAGDAKSYEQTFTVDESHIDQMLYFTYRTTGCPEEEDADGLLRCGIGVIIEKINLAPGEEEYLTNLSLRDGAYLKVPKGTYKITTDIEENPVSGTVATANVNINAFTNSSPYSNEYQVGGLRVLRIINDNDEGERLIKEYNYQGRTTNQPSGLLAAQKLSFYEPFIPCALESAYYPLQTSYSPIPSVSAGSSHLGYTEVTEASIPFNTGPGGTLPDHSDITRYANGYTVYKYDWLYDEQTPFTDERDDEHLIGIEGLPYAPYEELTWRRGNLLFNSTSKNSDGTFVKMNETAHDQGFEVTEGERWSHAVEGIKIIEEGAVRYHKYYNVVTGAYHINKTTTTQYENGEPLTSTTNYYYGDNFLRPSRVSSKNSQGDVLSNITKYADEVDEYVFPDEVEKEVLRAMVDKNMVNVPIMETSHSNLTLLSNNLTIYTANGTKFQPTSIRQLNRKTSDFEEKINFTYTPQHNYSEVIQPNGLTTTYIWSYNNSLPVAKVANATYQQVGDVLGADLSTIESGKLSDEEVRTILSQLRTELPNAQVLIYTYKPGVGTTSISDPNGQTTTYFYDNFNRLESVKDSEGKLLQSIKYNYRNSQ